MAAEPPEHIDLKKDRGLTIQWKDGTGSFYSINYLRRMSPSADQRELRKAMQHNPLTVLPATAGEGGLAATGAELVGNYAIRISFSDGHSTGLFTWEYLREIDPARQPDDMPEGHERAPGDDGPAHNNPLGL